MVKNEELEQVVLVQMAAKLKDDAQLMILAEGDEEVTKNIIQSMGEVRIDEKHKIRFHFSNYMGYGYDFAKQSSEGRNAREIYENAVKITKEFNGTKHVEQIIADGVEKDRFGWYITRFP